MSDTFPTPAFLDDAEIQARRPIRFTLPFALSSLNVRQRTHWAELSRERKSLAQEVMAAIGGPRYFPRPPFDRARVTVVRCSAGQLDPDALVGCVKPLLDVLCMASPTHPGSLGIIEDDNPRQCELVVKQSPAERGDGATVVLVEHVTGGVEPLAPVKRKRSKPAWAKDKPSTSSIARFERARAGWR